MRILIVSYFCPPEWAAPASRVFENASRLGRMGHEVTILTGLPNHPQGKLYPGYRYRLWQRERMGEVNVVRVGSLLAPNTTAFQRLKAYLTLMLAQMIGCLFTGPADVVIGTSPPLFTALAAYAAAVIKRCPFVFEVRDLWPENMAAVGAMRNKAALWILRRLERFLYHRAEKVIPVTQGFRDYIEDLGIPPEKTAVITNGVDLDEYRPVDHPWELARELGLEEKFIVAYIGTVGINHGVGIVLDAAKLMRDRPEVMFLVVGDGAERAGLEVEAAKRKLDNVRFTGARPREAMPGFHALADVLLVPLKKTDYFRRVIPSKIFVAMAMARPVIIGVEGESREIIEGAGAGVGVEPECARSVAETVKEMLEQKKEGRLEEMGRKGREAVERNFDWEVLAKRYQEVLISSVHGNGEEKERSENTVNRDMISSNTRE